MRGMLVRRALVALLAAPWAAWAIARTLGLDAFHPAVALMSFTALVAATAVVPLATALGAALPRRRSATGCGSSRCTRSRRSDSARSATGGPCCAAYPARRRTAGRTCCSATSSRRSITASCAGCSIGGYSDAADASGDGLVPTFPNAGQLPPMITIDHVLFSGPIRVRRFRAHDVAGSDHRAIVAELVVPGR